MEPSPDPTSPVTGKPITPTELARDWGCSRQYASKKIAAGCPTDTFANARAWLVANSPRGVGFRSKPKPDVPSDIEQPEGGVPSGEVAKKSPVGGGGEPPESETPPEPSLRKDLRLSSIELALENAIAIETEAHRLVQEAQKQAASDNPEVATAASGRISVLIAAYSKALDNRLSAEESVYKLRERLELLVTADFARNLLRKAWVPHLARLRSLSKRVAPKITPLSDEILVEKELAREVEDAIREGQAAFGIAKSPPGAPSPPAAS